MTVTSSPLRENAWSCGRGLSCLLLMMLHLSADFQNLPSIPSLFFMPFRVLCFCGRTEEEAQAEDEVFAASDEAASDPSLGTQVETVPNFKVPNVRHLFPGRPRTPDDVLPCSDVEEPRGSDWDGPSPSEFFEDGLFTDKTVKHIMPPALYEISAA